MQVSWDFVFDESASWYTLPSPNPDDSILITDDDASEANTIWEEEEDIDTLEESLIWFQLSGSNQELVWSGQSNDEQWRLNRALPMQGS